MVKFISLVQLITASLMTGNLLAEPNMPEDGIWKSAPIPENIASEFGRQDVYGLAVGVSIVTDCSIYWIYENNLYCFNSMTSRSYFMEKPKHYITRARATVSNEKKAQIVRTELVYLTRQYDEPLPLSLVEPVVTDAGMQGVKLSIKSSNIAGRLLGHEFILYEAIASESGDILETATSILEQGRKLIIADLHAEDLLAVADLAEAANAIIINIRAADDELRQKSCRSNVFHMMPSRAMRADAIAQYLIWKKWRRWFLISGKQPEDIAFSDAIKRAAKRFGGIIVDERQYQLETGSRRVETGHQQIQTQMPMLTRNAPTHDVVFVADEMESFGLYLPYRTTEPRPVVGSYGLVATAWHRSYEQYGGMSLQNSFEEQTGRPMLERDYLGWLAVKLFSEAVTRGPGNNISDIKAFMRLEDLSLAGYKGRPLSFRSWNQQLRQPVLLSSARALVSIAPIEGFLHQKHYTDTLGFDAPESICKL